MVTCSESGGSSRLLIAWYQVMVMFVVTADFRHSVVVVDLPVLALKGQIWVDMGEPLRKEGEEYLRHVAIFAGQRPLSSGQVRGVSAASLLGNVPRGPMNLNYLPPDFDFTGFGLDERKNPATPWAR